MPNRQDFAEISQDRADKAKDRWITIGIAGITAAVSMIYTFARVEQSEAALSDRVNKIESQGNADHDMLTETRNDVKWIRATLEHQDHK